MKVSSTTQILLYVDDTHYDQLPNLSTIKKGDGFMAMVGENIMSNSDLNVAQILFYK